MNNKYIVLAIAVVLIVIGLLKPDFSSIVNNRVTPDNNQVLVEKPSNVEILDECELVTNALKVNSDRRQDGLRLASLYNDMATLVSLDGEDMVIRNTEEIRQANKLAGLMLKLDIKGKYPKLALAAQNVIVSSIGDDSLMLDSKLRQDATDAFKALAWACYEGAK